VSLHERLVEVAAKAVSDRWGHRIDPPGRLAIEDARVTVYAILRHLADNADEMTDFAGLCVSARDLDEAADALDRERFLMHYGENHVRVPWVELQEWAKRQRLAREEEHSKSLRERYGEKS
jgi:hypothetical protein